MSSDTVDVNLDVDPVKLEADEDAAFAKLPKGTVEDLLKSDNKAKLTKILKHHVLPVKKLVVDLAKMKTAKTVEGSEVSVEDKGGKIMIGNAHMTNTDILCSNGVIHIVDTVIMPN